MTISIKTLSSYSQTLLECGIYMPSCLATALKLTAASAHPQIRPFQELPRPPNHLRKTTLHLHQLHSRRHGCREPDGVSHSGTASHTRCSHKNPQVPPLVKSKSQAAKFPSQHHRCRCPPHECAAWHPGNALAPQRR